MSDLDFLKLIYELGGTFHAVNNGDIAKKADLSNASVTERIKNLATHTDLLSYKRYYGVMLTKKGIKTLDSYVQQQRLLEVWLVQEMNYSLLDCHKEADILSNQVSKHFIENLNKYLNTPKLCPHGNIIPNNAKSITEKQTNLVDGLKKDQEYTIQSFSEDDYIFELLENVDIRLNDAIKVMNVTDDIVVILNLRTNSKQLLPKTLAAAIRVKQKKCPIIS
ncbi:metal-dependent transcriptional regulator [Companilactobacillus kedongensis]|uniref:metal-dependent transcriptional regulator n=1 Tax=Companilactobacillus kedongensis TaxID=2486004 RepID=UPI000F79A624|nr:metal-dependent transcriptional regulator [Companilactobacillus kedongensis]